MLNLSVLIFVIFVKIQDIAHKGITSINQLATINH